MRATLRIPTKEQYAYIELEVEVENTEQAVEIYEEAVKMVNGGFGISRDEFNEALDRYLKDGTGDTEQYAQMNTEQQRVFQEIKKSIKRVNGYRHDNREE